MIVSSNGAFRGGPAGAFQGTGKAVECPSRPRAASANKTLADAD
jgi:hypothetical protein